MPLLELSGLTIAYDVFGPPGGDPVVLICGLSQPAGSWQLSMVPALTDNGHFVVTFDNRGVEPSSAPPAPYTVDQMVEDTLALVDHLGIQTASILGYSMGGWIAETLAFRHPDRVKRAVFIGSCNAGTSWEKAITTLERDMAALDPELPKLYNAIETIRYLPNHDLQNDDVVDLWLQLIVDIPPWSNPGRLGQYEAALAWSTDYERIERWPQLEVECLILAFEHDIDSPPARALEAASQIPRSSYVEIQGASHLGVFTHADSVAAEVVSFLNPNRRAAP
jgi:pimeloyl-ACP methyl ester carboxylesterase